MSRVRAMAKAYAVRAVLNRVTRGEATAGPTAGSPPRPVAEAEARPRRAVLPLVLLTLGVIAMVPFESPVTRVIGVLALAGFVVSGVFAIADPRWLGSATDDERS
jgi:hypothetical protein